jgi:hypothetical protein
MSDVFEIGRGVFHPLIRTGAAADTARRRQEITGGKKNWIRSCNRRQGWPVTADDRIINQRRYTQPDVPLTRRHRHNAKHAPTGHADVPVELTVNSSDCCRSGYTMPENGSPRGLIDSEYYQKPYAVIHLRGRNFS